MAFKDGNDKNNNLNQGNEGLHEDSPEMKKYQREKREAIDAAKRMESELAQKLEDHESHRESQEVEELMRKADNPQPQPEGNNNPEEELRRIFEKIETDHIVYNFVRRIFPKFTQVCEESRLGKSFTRDFLGFTLGVGDSIMKVIQLSGHLIIDTAIVIARPRISYQETIRRF